MADCSGNTNPTDGTQAPASHAMLRKLMRETNLLSMITIGGGLMSLAVAALVDSKIPGPSWTVTLVSFTLLSLLLFVTMGVAAFTKVIYCTHTGDLTREILLILAGQILFVPFSFFTFWFSAVMWLQRVS